MQIASYSNFRKNLKSFMDKVHNDCTPVFISKRNGEEFVLIRKDTYDSLNETEYLLSNPANKKKLLKALKDTKKGNCLEFNSVKDFRNEFGI